MFFLIIYNRISPTLLVKFGPNRPGRLLLPPARTEFLDGIVVYGTYLTDSLHCAASLASSGFQVQLMRAPAIFLTIKIQ